MAAPDPNRKNVRKELFHSFLLKERGASIDRKLTMVKFFEIFIYVRDRGVPSTGAHLPVMVSIIHDCLHPVIADVDLPLYVQPGLDYVIVAKLVKLVELGP